jgi:hypothetical protein
MNASSVNAIVNGYAADVARTSTKGRRARGHIRRRGGSFQVLVYAGTDPLIGKPNYLTESTPDEAQAQKILTRLLAQVDERRNPRTKATMGTVLDSWLRTHEAEVCSVRRTDVGRWQCRRFGRCIGSPVLHWPRP